MGVRDRKAPLAERRNDAEFTVNRVRRRQQFAERLPTHHIGTTRRIQPVGRVGLAALKLQDVQGSGIPFDMFSHPSIELELVKAMAVLDSLGA